jgi:probable F420-dependent oxidoreductase
MTAIHLPPSRSTVGGTVALAGALEAAGYDGVWAGEVSNLDAVVPTALAAIGTKMADLGVLLNVYTRGPATLAMTAATLADVAPGRMHVVLGAASPLLVERWNGIPYDRPGARLRDCLRFVRLALAGRPVKGAFDTFAADGFSLVEAPATPPTLLVAASGPRSLALAAAEADGVVLNWMAAADLGRLEVLPADRSRVSMVFAVCPSSDRAVVDTLTRPLLTSYLTAPAYADLQRRLGRGPALAAMWEAWAMGDRRRALAQLPAAVIDELVIWGSPERCRRTLASIEAETGVRAVATLFLPPSDAFLDAAAALATGKRASAWRANSVDYKARRA